MTPLHPIADKREARDMQAALDMVTIRSRLSLATEIVRLRQAFATVEQQRISEGEVRALIERLNGPHEWGYRCLADGGFIVDDTPFKVAEALISSPVAPDG